MQAIAFMSFSKTESKENLDGREALVDAPYAPSPSAADG
jgi:hypothetical protein